MSLSGMGMGERFFRNAWARAVCSAIAESWPGFDTDAARGL